MNKKVIYLTLAAVLGISTGSAQETRSTIFGRVTDPQNAGVVNASVIVTNVNTNTPMTLRTNDTGYYEADLLLPGSYRISVAAAGFKKSVRSGIVLPLSARVEVNVTLQLGASAETVEVTAEAPLLDATASVSAGGVMDNRDVVDLPIFNNSPLMMIKLAPGVQSSNNRRYNGVNALGGTADAHAVGGFTNYWSIDGVPDMGNGSQVAYMPYATTIQEYKVETQNFDASVGHMAGISIATMTKAGTNALHGDLTEEYWNQRWNGTPFFVKQAYFRSIAQAEASGNQALARQLRNSQQQPPGHDNDYGADIGGPVIIPKIFDGRNKLFFFFSFDGFDDRKTTGSANNNTVPTLQERQGDFSDLLAVNANKYQLYDPLSVGPDPARPGHFVRQPIPGNVIPKNRSINPVYDTYVKFLPAPNNLPASANLEPLNDYVDPSQPYNWFYEAYANRFDYDRSQKNRFFGRWNWLKYREDRQDWTHTTDRGLMTNGVNRNNLGLMADWVYTPSANTVFDVEGSANNFREGNILSPVALAFTPSAVGLPAYLDAKAGTNHALPVMSFSGYNTLGQAVPNWTHYEVLSIAGNAFHIRGAHTFRAGIDVRDHRRSGGDPGNASGLYSFDNAYTCREDDCLTTTGSLGYSWASFMMGLPTTSSIDTNATYATSNPYIGWYAQDNWRVSSKLSLNLGFRMEYEFGIKERYSRQIAGFDPTVTLPITALAEAAYARNPIPELAGSAFAVLGGSQYTNTNGVSARFPAGQLMFLPRIGVAYQLNGTTVLRGGYGIYYDTLNAQTLAPDQSGFSRTTSDPSSTNFGQTWLSGDPGGGISPMVDPFPVRSDGTRFDAPVGNALGLMAKDGSGWTFIDPNFKRARVQRWRVELERQFGSSMVVSLAYTGMRADDLRITRTLSALPAQFWTGGDTRNNAVASNLNQNVANPFYIGNFASLQTSDPVTYQALSSRAFFLSPTIRKNQLLQPFAQMNGLSESGPYGAEKAHSVEAAFRRRFAQGFTLSANFTGLYERDRDYYYNQFDPSPSWELTNNGVPYRFAATGIYELPFGKGRQWIHSTIPAAIVGGWQIAATYEWQPGPLLQWGNLFYNGDVNDICSGSRTLDQWFNTSNFVTSSAQQPAAFQARVFPTRIGNCRADGLNVLSGNVQRTFRIREKLSFQLRMDALNVLNHSQFNPPDLVPTDSTFGKITDNTSSTMRFILIQARLRF